MYDREWIENAIQSVKDGRPFWAPADKWYFAVQREYHTEECPGTRFMVKPVFTPNTLVIMPVLARLVAIDFTQPYPNLVMLMHNGSCVWNWVTVKPMQGEVLRVDLKRFEQHPIVTLTRIPNEVLNRLGSAWMAMNGGKV